MKSFMTSARIKPEASNDTAANEQRQRHQHLLQHGAGKAREVAVPMEHKAPTESAEHPPPTCPGARS